jgi:hypothetical protein
MSRTFFPSKAPRALALAFSLCVTVAAAADPVPGVLDFDELPPSAIGTHLPAGYGGFTWGGQWYEMSQTPAGGNNFLATSTSGGTLIRRNDRSAFHFDGADFWSRRGLDGTGDFFFVLYGESGEVLYNGDVDGNAGRMRFSNTPTFLQANYTGAVHAMAFGFDNDDYDHLAMDNFRFRATAVSAVPEPSIAVMVSLGLGLFLVSAWKAA